MPDTTEQILRDLRRRRDELQPLVGELSQIESAITALEGVLEQRQPADRRRRGPRTGGARRGRPRKGQATRTDQFLALVNERPGVTVPEAAQDLGVHPNYLYRISSTLQREGSIQKQGRGFVPSVVAPAGGEQADVVSPPAEEEAVQEPAPPAT